MNAAAITQGLQIAGILFRLGAAALERSDNETAKAVLGVGNKIVNGVQTTGRIDEATAADVRKLEAQLDADGVPSGDEWKAMASKVRASAARWGAAG